MDRICPLLALGLDLRTAVDGYDPDHRCTAEIPAIALDRGVQQRLCLHEGHRECQRFRDWSTRRAASAPSPHPALDATFASTRLVVEPDAAWLGVALPARRVPRPGRVAVGAAVTVLAVGSVAAAGASTHGFGLLTTTTPSAVPSPVPSSTPGSTPTPAPTATPTPEPTASSIPTPTAAPATPTAEPTLRTYRVQSGDTLSSIAHKFGVTVKEIEAVNVIPDPNALQIGQLLVIP